MTNEEQEGLQLDVWFALRELDQRVEDLLSASPPEAPASAVDPEPPELWEDYQSIRARLRGPVLDLQATLQRALPEPRARAGESLAHRIWAAILIHYDERELNRIRHHAGRPRLLLLQTEHCDLYDGGEQFFVYLENALRTPGTPSLVLQLFLFCMRAHFCGRYASPAEPERMAYEAELCRRVAEEREPARAQGASALPPPLPGVAFPFGVYAVALAFSMGVWFALEAMADVHQAARSGLTCAAH